MSHGDTIPLHSSSQSDIDEIENLIYSNPSTVLPARPPSPPRAAIPVSSSPFMPSNLRPPPPPTSTTTNNYKPTPVPAIPSPPPLPSSGQSNIAATGFGSPPNTLTEPVWDTVKRDLSRIVSNLKLVVFPNPYREDPGKALRDWDLWGPFFFIVFLGLTLSWSASVKKSEVFAVAFALLAAGAVILTLNVLLLGGHIIFFQSLSLLGYCLFPLDVGAFICMLKDNVILKVVVVCEKIKKMASNSTEPTASKIVAKLNLKVHPEGGFYSETFRDNSVILSRSHLPSTYKVDRPISTCIYFLLPSGSASHLHRIPCAETWHFYMGEPITVMELNETDGKVKLTCVGPDPLVDDQFVQYTVPPNVWFGAFPTKDYNISSDMQVTKAPTRDGEKHFSLVGCTCAPAFQFEDFELAKRSDLVSRFPAHESLVSLLAFPDL